MLDFTKGGPITYSRDHCKGCDPTQTNAQLIAAGLGGQELQRHNRSRYVPLDNTFHPGILADQKEDIACKEVAGVYPLAAGNEIWLNKVTPYKFATYLFYVPEACEATYGVADQTGLGFTFDVVSQAFDINGAPVGASTVHMAGLALSTATKQGIALTPAAGGIASGANYLLFGIKPVTNPTNNPLSQVKCGFRLTTHAIGD